MKKFPVIALFLLVTVAAQSQTFSVLLDRIQALPDVEKVKQLDDFVGRKPEIPIIENNNDVYFIYKGIAAEMSIAGDATGWSPSLPMEKISGTDYWYCHARYEADARLEYKIVIDKTNWKLDPLNNEIAHGGMGDNSELKMPHYKPAEYIYERDAVPWGTFADTAIYSKFLKEPRQIRIYLPPRYDNTTDNYPVIIFHDGFEYFDRMAVRDVLDNMTFEKKIRPVIAVFIQPVHRDPEYSGRLQKKYTKFIVSELMPFIQKNYRAKPGAENKASAGISNGGNISLWLAASHPEVFGKAGAQSSNVEKNVLSAFNKKDLSKSKIYVDFGKYDLPVLVPLVHELKEILEKRQIPHTYIEFPEGHNWKAWQKQLPLMLEYLFPAE